MRRKEKVKFQQSLANYFLATRIIWKAYDSLDLLYNIHIYDIFNYL
jgi:hypothetical protein